MDRNDIVEFVNKEFYDCSYLMTNPNNVNEWISFVPQDRVYDLIEKILNERVK